MCSLLCSCGVVTPFDGLEDRVFNYNNIRLFTHALLNSYTSQYTVSQTSFTAFHESTERSYYEQQLQPLPFISLPVFIGVWFSFIDIQEWVYDWLCPWCGRYPKDIVCDGITLSLPKVFCSLLRTPTAVSSTSEEVQICAVPTRFMRDRGLAARLILYTRGVWGRDKWTDKKELSQQQVAEMSNELAASYPELYQFINWMAHGSSLSQEQMCLCMRLVRVLASDEPLAQFVRSPTPTLLRKIVRDPTLAVNQDVLYSLTELCPLLFALLSELPGMPLELMQLLWAVANRAEEIEKQQDTRMPKEMDKDDRRRASYKHNQRYRKEGVYSGMDPIRERPKYSIDGNGLGSGEIDSTSCNKLRACFKTISGGCMIIWCRHRIALAFHIIASAEGRNDVFSEILVHWPTAPRTICYDFACQLMAYNTVREPAYFKNTLHLIDVLHGKNHTTCSEAFMMKQYKEGQAKRFVYFNDQVAECGNAGLLKIRNSCLYMSNGRFMDFVRLQLEVQNRMRIRLLNETDNRGATNNEELAKEKQKEMNKEKILPEFDMTTFIENIK